MQKRVREQIQQAIISALRKTGERAFSLSQQKCPVISGALKASGKTEDIDQGFELRYEKDYASFPERGVSPGTIHVASYRKRNGTRVKSYSYYSRGQRAQRYIGSSMDEAFKNSRDFARNFENELRISLRAKISKV